MALLAVVALAAVFLSMAAMHASMVAGHGPSGHDHPAIPTTMAMPAAAASPADSGTSSDHALGDMNLADCLLLGMVCFLSAVAVLLLAVVIGNLRSLLRPRALAQSLLAPLGPFRPPRPPSLFVLSISRT